MAHRHPMNNYRMYKNEDVEELIREFEISKVAKRVSMEPARREPVEPEKPKTKRLRIDVL